MASLRFALFGNVYQQHKSAAIRVLLNSLRSHGAQIFIEKEYYDFLRSAFSEFTDSPDFVEFDSFAEVDADFAISMGGDGTLLKTASMVREKQTPIVGINMGRLGFLADVSVDDVETCVDALYRDDYSVEDRSLIRVETNGEPLNGYECALNDVAILKRDSASMISIRTSINGEYLTTYQADGLIVGTPTGSTAYSLSVGGPIVVPQLHAMMLTPVAPHSLNMRPLVVSDTSVVDLRVKSRSGSFLVSLDGRSASYRDNIDLRIRLAPYKVKVITHVGHTFFSTLRQKMMWGIDGRENL